MKAIHIHKRKSCVPVGTFSFYPERGVKSDGAEERESDRQKIRSQYVAPAQADFLAQHRGRTLYETASVSLEIQDTYVQVCM